MLGWGLSGVEDEGVKRLSPYDHLPCHAIVQPDDIDSDGQGIDAGRAGGEGEATDQLAGKGDYLRTCRAVGGDEEAAVAGKDAGAGLDFGVGNGRRVLRDAADRDDEVATDVLHDVGSVAGTRGDGLATAGCHDGDRLVVVRIECEVEAEVIRRLDIVTAGYRVGRGSFHRREGDGVVGWLGVGIGCRIDRSRGGQGEQGSGDTALFDCDPATVCTRYACCKVRTARNGGTGVRVADVRPASVLLLLPLIGYVCAFGNGRFRGQCHPACGCMVGRHGSGAGEVEGSSTGYLCHATGVVDEGAAVVYGGDCDGRSFIGIQCKSTCVGDGAQVIACAGQGDNGGCAVGYFRCLRYHILKGGIAL